MRPTIEDLEPALPDPLHFLPEDYAWPAIDAEVLAMVAGVSLVDFSIAREHHLIRGAN